MNCRPDSRRRRLLAAVISAAALVLPNLTADASAARSHPDDSWVQVTPLDPHTWQDGGAGVALSPSGGTALVAAPYDGEHGAAIVFTEVGGRWQRTAKLHETGLQDGAHYGWGLALSGDGTTALVGAPYADRSGGAAFVYHLAAGVWSRVAVLRGGDVGPKGAFGISVGLSLAGRTAIVGAPGFDDGRGAAYLFHEAGGTWRQSAKLMASDPQVDGRFGTSVSISGSGARGVVGAPGVVNYRGAAYIYETNDGTWSQVSRVTGLHGNQYDEFGTGVAISGDGFTVLIGAPERGGHGAAYVFQTPLDAWMQTAVLIGGDTAGEDRFGFAVGLSRNGATALVGAPSGTAATRNYTDGAGYVFTQSDGLWNQDAELLPFDPSGEDETGYSVSLAAPGRKAILGAPHHRTFTGIAYLYAAQAG